MRWILALAALVAAISILRNRQRRARIQETVRKAVPPDVRARGEEATATLGDMAAKARDRVSEAQAQATETASRVADAARSAADAATAKAQELAAAARQGAGDAAANVQEAAGAVSDRAGQAAETAAGAAQQATTDAKAGPEAAEPSVGETVQAELADIGEKAENIRAKAQAPAEAAEKSAGATLGAGTVNGTDMKTAMAPGTPATEEAPPEEGTAERKRHRAAGEGTTTASGEAVDALSPATGGPTATGAAAPAPSELAPGTPGTGGPAASSRAPSAQDDTATKTTGKEQPPEIDRATEVLQRSSGDFIGNKHTRVFHAATAGNLPAEENRVYFESEEEALAAGFQPAKNEGLESAEA